MKRLAMIAGTVGALALTLSWSQPSDAGCVDGIGCTTGSVIPYPALYNASCGDLWFLRNSAFADNGYCFKTARGQSVFGNGGCIYRNSGDVPMTRAERANVERIRQVEREQGCR